MELKRKIAYVVYHIFAKRLPVSYSWGGKIGKFFRGKCTKIMLPYCGENVNIEKGAMFQHGVQSGIIQASELMRS